MDSTDVDEFCEMSFKYFDYSGSRRRPSSKGIGEKLGSQLKSYFGVAQSLFGTLRKTVGEGAKHGKRIVRLAE